MKSSLKPCLVLLGVLLVASLAAQASPSTTALEKDLVYASPGGIDLRLDLAYGTAAGERRPLLVFIPANAYGWDTAAPGDINWKGSLKNNLQDALGRGYAAAAVNFRALGQVQAASFPMGAMFDDLRAALAWLLAHAENYHLDPARVAILGYASASDLALGLAYGLPGADLKPPSAPPASVKAVVVSGGIFDHGAIWQSDHRIEPASTRSILLQVDMELCGGDPDEKREQSLAASPVRYITPQCPATFLIYGDADTDPGVAEQAKIGDAALAAAGVRHQLVVVPGKKGNFLRMPEVWAFLGRELLGK